MGGRSGFPEIKKSFELKNDTNTRTWKYRHDEVGKIKEIQDMISIVNAEVTFLIGLRDLTLDDDKLKDCSKMFC